MILVNMIAEYGIHLLEQAREQGMLSKGYAWLVTEGMTSYSVSREFDGLIGTSPSTWGSALQTMYSVSYSFIIIIFLFCPFYHRSERSERSETERNCENFTTELVWILCNGLTLEH